MMKRYLALLNQIVERYSIDDAVIAKQGLDSEVAKQLGEGERGGNIVVIREVMSLDHHRGMRLQLLDKAVQLSSLHMRYRRLRLLPYR